MDLGIIIIKIIQEPIYLLSLAVLIVYLPIFIFFIIQCIKNDREFKRGEEEFKRRTTKEHKR